MQIFVELLDRQKVTLDVEASDTIDVVKRKIEDRFGQGHLTVFGRCFFMKFDFAGSDTIEDVKAKILDEEGGLEPDFENVTFSYFHGQFSVTVNIAMMSGKTIAVEASKADSIYNVKRMVQGKAGIPAELQSLMYAEQELHNGREVGDYNIPNNATLQLVRNLPQRYADFRDVYDGEDSENEDEPEYPLP
jgi:ubiquitin C